MFLEAEVVSQVVDNEELYYLAALNAAGGHAKRRARLTGRMHEKVATRVAWSWPAMP